MGTFAPSAFPRDIWVGKPPSNNSQINSNPIFDAMNLQLRKLTWKSISRCTSHPRNEMCCSNSSGNVNELHLPARAYWGNCGSIAAVFCIRQCVSCFVAFVILSACGCWHSRCGGKLHEYGVYTETHIARPVPGLVLVKTSLVASSDIYIGPEYRYTTKFYQFMLF